MKTVALLSHSPAVAGAERMLLNLAIGLRDLPDFRPVVLIPCPHLGTLAAELDKVGVEWQTQGVQPFFYVEQNYVTASVTSAFAVATEMAEILWSIGADVVVANTLTNLEGPLASKIAGLPCVLWVHGIIDGTLSNIQSYPYKETCEQIIMDWAARVVCCSKWTEDAYRSRAPSKVETIWNWTSVDEINNCTYSGKRFSFLSGVVWHKGIESLIKAVSILKSSSVDVGLDIYGDGHLKKQMVEEAAALQIDDVVHFHERTSDVLRVYRESLAVVMPSFVESFGMVTVEAMAQGTPVIVSRVGEQDNIVQDNVSGLIFEPGNAVELAAKMRLLIETPGLARRLGDAAHQRAKLEFSGKGSIARFAELLSQVADEFGGYVSTQDFHLTTLKLLIAVGEDSGFNRLQSEINLQLQSAINLQLQSEIRSMQASTLWRIMNPARHFFDRYPRIRAGLRRVAKLA